MKLPALVVFKIKYRVGGGGRSRHLFGSVLLLCGNKGVDWIYEFIQRKCTECFLYVGCNLHDRSREVTKPGETDSKQVIDEIYILSDNAKYCEEEQTWAGGREWRSSLHGVTREGHRGKVTLEQSAK